MLDFLLELALFVFLLAYMLRIFIFILGKHTEDALVLCS